jgi:alkylated DNA repair dioxygenase AlkB
VTEPAADTGAPALDPEVQFERLALDEHSWVDLARGWIRNPGAVYEHLAGTVAWRQNRLWRYERWVDEPRLGAGYGRAALPHPVLRDALEGLERRYRVQFAGLGLAYYRDGNDSQAFHRDRDMRWLDDTLICIITFGARRPWLLRRRDRRDKWIAELGGAEYDLAPGAGDVFVMGGATQVGWEHSVPKVPGAPARLAGRISAQLRWTSGRGRPVVGPSYQAPRNFSRSDRR